MSNIHCPDCGALMGHFHNVGCPKLGPAQERPVPQDVPDIVKIYGRWYVRAGYESRVEAERAALLLLGLAGLLS